MWKLIALLVTVTVIGAAAMSSDDKGDTPNPNPPEPQPPAPDETFADCASAFAKLPPEVAQAISDATLDAATEKSSKPFRDLAASLWADAENSANPAAYKKAVNCLNQAADELEAGLAKATKDLNTNPGTVDPKYGSGSLPGGFGSS
jgi:hypothetical protein